MNPPKVLLSGLGIPESPRWHAGRLWFCNWIERQIVAVSLDGKPDVASAKGPVSMGYSIDWQLDGRLLVTGDKLRRQEPDGSLVTLAEQPCNEIVVDGRDNVYINGADFDFPGGEAPKPGYIKLFTPDGKLQFAIWREELDVAGLWRLTTGEVEVRAVDVDVVAPIYNDLVARLLGEGDQRPVGLLPPEFVAGHEQSAVQLPVNGIPH